MSGLARTYRGAASAAGPLLYLAETRRAALGEWVEIEASSGTYRGQVIDVGAGITVVQVLEDTLGLHPGSARITLTGEQARAVVGLELSAREASNRPTLDELSQHYSADETLPSRRRAPKQRKKSM